MEETKLPRSILLAIILAIALFASATVARSAQAPGKTYAVLINGGGGYPQNDPRFDTHLGEIYEALKARGVFPHNIYVTSGNGTATGIRSKDWFDKNPSQPTPLSYGRKDKKSAASKRSLNRIVAELSKKVKAQDQVLFFVTGPAGKDKLSAPTKLKFMSGEGFAHTDLEATLKKLPQGATKVVVTDIPFGGDWIDINVKNGCSFAAFSSDEVGSYSQSYFSKFAESIKKEGTSIRSADFGANETGRDSLALWIERELKVVSNTLAAQAKNTGRAPASATLSVSSDGTVEEMAKVLSTEKQNFFDADLQARWTYFKDESYTDRMKKIKDAKMKYPSSLKQAVQNRAGEPEGNRLREEKLSIVTEEKKLEKRYRDLGNEMRFVLTASPTQLEQYQERKRCSLHDI